MEEALGAIDTINGDYRWHCEAARAIAEEFKMRRTALGR